MNASEMSLLERSSGALRMVGWSKFHSHCPEQKLLDATIRRRLIVLLDARHAVGTTTETVMPNGEPESQFGCGGRIGVMVFGASKGRQRGLVRRNATSYGKIGGGRIWILELDRCCC